MKQWSDPSEEEQVNQIRRIVKQKEMPQESYANQILERLDHMKRSSEIKSTRKWKKKVAISATAAAMLGGVVLGSGFVSPVMADALKNVPLIGSVFQYNEDSSLQKASTTGLTTAPNLSVTKDGVTLSIIEVMFDGNRLAFAIERQGVDDDTMFSPYLPEGAKDENGNLIPSLPLEQQKKGYIYIPDVSIQGKNKFFGMLSEDVGKTEDGQDIHNIALYEITKGLAEMNLPEAFDMTVQLNVSGIKEPFEFVVPVQNLAKGSVVLHPNQTKSSGDFSYTVKQLELTPVTTQLVLDSKGQVPATAEQTGDLSPSKMYYDIVDQDGNPVQQRLIEYPHSAPDTEYHEDEAYKPFANTPTSITIKPYTLTVKKDWSLVTDSAGKKVKTYHKDLEMTIPVIQK